MVFNYVTKDLSGVTHKGEIEAGDEKAAAAILRKKRLIIISIKPKSDKGRKLFDNIFNRVSFADIVVMTRQLATMIGAGLVISEALDILSEEQTNKKFKQVLEQVSSDVKGGLDLGTSLEKHPDVFPKLYISLIRAGELSGKLDEILLELATHLEKDKEFRSKVKGAMIYPIVVISMMFVVMLIMVFFVMPKLMTLYQNSSIELPLPTKIMLGFANFLINFWWLVLIVLTITTVISVRLLKKPNIRFKVDEKVLKIPIIGRIITIIILTNFTRTFGLLISAGLPILESIKISQDIVGNMSFKQALIVSYQGVERGLPFSGQLLSQPVFPKIVGQMVKTGEDTGKLDEIVSKLADYFEAESDNALKNITTLIEPLILLVLGVGVAFLVISIILPIYKLTTSIS